MRVRQYSVERFGEGVRDEAGEAEECWEWVTYRSMIKITFLRKK